MNIVYWNFSRVFDIVPCKILVDKLLTYGLDEQTVKWFEKWLNSQVISHAKVLKSTSRSNKSKEWGTGEILHCVQNLNVLSK